MLLCAYWENNIGKQTHNDAIYESASQKHMRGTHMRGGCDIGKPRRRTRTENILK